MSFQAKIKLGTQKNAPLTHAGFKGRVLKKGDAFTTTSAEEAEYYRAQPGFSVSVIKGKLKRAEPVEIDIPDGVDLDDSDEVEEHDADDGDDGEESVSDAQVSGGYLRADLKKLSRDELKALIDSDEDLPLKSRDVPKKSGKKEIINLILDAQRDRQRDE